MMQEPCKDGTGDFGTEDPFGPQNVRSRPLDVACIELSTIYGFDPFLKIPAKAESLTPLIPPSLYGEDQDPE